VLHLAANRWWTGGADPTIQLVSGLRARGHHVLLGVIPGDRFEAKAKEAGLDVVPRLGLSPRLAPLALAADVTRLRQLVRAEAIEVIHAHHSHDHWLALAAGVGHPARHGPRVARTFHNTRAVKSEWPARMLYRRTSAAFAVSREIEARCQAVGFPAERVHWTPGVVDVARFDGSADPAPIRDEFKLGDAPVIVCVSRLAANRGHELLLSAYRYCLARVPAARLLLVGKGEERARLEHVVADLALDDRVVFAGYRDRDLPAVLAAADCVAVVGAGSDESCRAALEAMAAARAVVARRVGALQETVIHGETGLLLEAREPAALGHAIAELLADPARARAMGQAARRRAREAFIADRLVSTVERVYLALR
jgi:glycosyltransferase involved in cell wall biosynthesis